MLGDSININFNYNPVVLKKIGKTSKNYNFWAQLAQKSSHYGPYRKPKTNFFTGITKPDHMLSKTFYFIKISYVFAELWMLCDAFLCDAFLLKRVISSHNSFEGRSVSRQQKILQFFHQASFMTFTNEKNGRDKTYSSTLISPTSLLTSLCLVLTFSSLILTKFMNSVRTSNVHVHQRC